MTDHLSSLILNALADGELSADQLAATNQHLAGCPACTSSALSLTLLKSATAKAGKRFVPDSDLQARILHQIRQNSSPQSTPRLARHALLPKWRLALYGWTTALALLLASVGVLFVQHRVSRSTIASAQYAALATEVCDRHVATLAANEPPQVISSDRHTVKPWFQGKLPFSFNLPEDLPSDTTLDGANLTYIQNKPAAQLLYSIGKHHVSVYLVQKTDTQSSERPATDHSGFHVVSFSTRELDGIAVSDVDSSRLSDLVSRFKSAQN